MKWWKRLVERWRRFIAETAEANTEMWKGGTPSCCTKDKNKELPKDK